MELYKLSALDTINLLKSEEVSPLDCLKSLQNRIDEVNQHVNALPTLCFDRAEQKAKNLMKRNKKQLKTWISGYYPKRILDTWKQLDHLTNPCLSHLEHHIYQLQY